MAKIFYELKKNMNEDSAAYGKYYAHIKAIETLDTRKLAQHIGEHGSVYTSDVVLGVMEKFRTCLVEMLLESKKVKIDGLGIFYCTIENALGGAESPAKFNVQKNLTALHIRFLPEQEQEMNISSREFIKKAEFINIATLLKGDDGTTENTDITENSNEGGGNSGSQSGSQSGSGSTQTGEQTGDNSASQGGSQTGDNSGSQGGGTDNSGTQSGGTQSGGDNSGSNSGSGNQGGNGGGNDDDPEGFEN